jgi:hypothetical protein
MTLPSRGHRPTAPEGASGSLPGAGRLVVLLVAVAVTAAMVPMALATLPLAPESQSGVLVTAGTCIYCPALHPRAFVSLPYGPTVELSWQEPAGNASVLSAWSPTGTPVCASSNGQGSCSFISEGGQYTVGLAPPLPPLAAAYSASYSFTYLEPLL